VPDSSNRSGQSFDSLLAALDNRRAEFLHALESLPPHHLATSPGGAKWSPLQIGEHLLKSEAGLAYVMGRQIEKGDARRDVGKVSERSVEGLIQAMRTPAQFKVPTGVPSILPAADETPSLAQLREDWQQTGNTWHELAEALPVHLAHTGLVSHAVAGALTFEQTLRFLESHIEHHLHQLSRTVRVLNAA